MKSWYSYISNAWGVSEFGPEWPISELYKVYFCLFVEKNVIQVQTPETISFAVLSTGLQWPLISSSAFMRPPTSASCPKKCADAQAISNPISCTVVFQSLGLQVFSPFVSNWFADTWGNFSVVKDTWRASLLQFPHCISKLVSSTDYFLYIIFCFLSSFLCFWLILWFILFVCCLFVRCFEAKSEVMIM